MSGKTDALAVAVLVIDDDVEFAQMMQQYLDAEGGFTIEVAHEGLAGASRAASDDFDVVVLDVGLPGIDGFEVLRRIRDRVGTPVIMLTARGDDIDRILGLEIGADDYLPKPCNFRELTARIRAILRRTRAAGEPAAQVERTVVGDLELEVGAQSAYVRGVLLPLTSAEFLVLEALVTAAGEIVDRDTISRHALGRRALPHDRSVDAHVSNLRRKLGPLPDGRQRIRSVRGQGYLYLETP
ncbi:MAG: response regulator transcription factor [Pseudomonadales bacterium]|jgi:two-component system response regulator CpxR|nr:response regulator transcription factor [Pseudomonadales bacterium]